MTTTKRPVTLATVAEWRRRKEADGGLPSDGHNGQLVNGHGGPSVNGHGAQPVNGHNSGPSVNGHGGPSVNGHGERPRNGYEGRSANGHGEQPRNGPGGLSTAGEDAKMRNGFRVAAYMPTAHPRQTSPAGPSEPGQPVSADAREQDPAQERQPGFAEAQQAALTAIFSIAKADAPSRSRPAAQPHAARPQPLAPPQDLAAGWASPRNVDTSP